MTGSHATARQKGRIGEGDVSLLLRLWVDDEVDGVGAAAPSFACEEEACAFVCW